MEKWRASLRATPWLGLSRSPGAGLPPEELLAQGGVYAALARRQLQRGRETLADSPDGVDAALETLLTDGSPAPDSASRQGVFFLRRRNLKKLKYLLFKGIFKNFKACMFCGPKAIQASNGVQKPNKVENPFLRGWVDSGW